MYAQQCKGVLNILRQQPSPEIHLVIFAKFTVVILYEIQAGFKRAVIDLSPSLSLSPHLGIGEMYPPFPIWKLNEVVIFPKGILGRRRKGLSSLKCNNLLHFQNSWLIFEIVSSISFILQQRHHVHQHQLPHGEYQQQQEQYVELSFAHPHPQVACSTLFLSWPKKYVLGCVIPPAGEVAQSRNLAQTFFANSVYVLNMKYAKM